MAVRPDPADQSSKPSLSLHNTQDAILKIHEHLIDISRLICEEINKPVKQQPDYKQAYLSEHRKLLEMAAAQNALADSKQHMEKENAYLRLQLIPQYENTLKRHEEMNLEAQVLTKGLETKLSILEKVNSEEQQKHARALEAAISLLNQQIQKVRDLEQEIEYRSKPSKTASPQIRIMPQPRRSSRLANLAGFQVAGHSLHGRKSAL